MLVYVVHEWAGLSGLYGRQCQPTSTQRCSLEVINGVDIADKYLPRVFARQRGNDGALV